MDKHYKTCNDLLMGLDQIREENKIHKKKISEMMNYSENWYRKYLATKRSLNIYILERIANVLGYKIDVCLKYNGVNSCVSPEQLIPFLEKVRKKRGYSLAAMLMHVNYTYNTHLKHHKNGDSYKIDEKFLNKISDSLSITYDFVLTPLTEG